jgi:hypothetical protein
VFHHENPRDTGREAIEAGLLAIALDQVFKRSFGRERFIVRRHGDEKAGVLSKADLEIVPIRNGLAARLRM